MLDFNHKNRLSFHITTDSIILGGTNWKLQFPIESQIKEELERLLNQEEKTKTKIAIEFMLWIIRRQMFIDANKIMIDNGCGIITISQENQPTFFEKIIKFYETSIDGIDLNNN